MHIATFARHHKQKQEQMTKLLNKIPKRVVMYLVSLGALLVWYGGFQLLVAAYPQFSGIPYAMSKALLGVITLRAVDDFVYPNVNTESLFNKNAQAYAIYMVAYAIIIALAIMPA